MIERLERTDPVIKVEEAVKKALQDIGERIRNPDLLDRFALPVDRWVTETLASMLGMSPEEIAEIRDSE